ncbi:hypothetical protein EBQ81_02705 [bacterium]|nr:hypothetical protein [bacterium]
MVVALVGAIGPTVAALAAWRAAVGTKREVTTNNGRRAGDYIESIGRVASDVHVLRIETAAKHAQLRAEIESLRDDDRHRFAEVDHRLGEIERAVCPDQPLRIHRGQSGL